MKLRFIDVFIEIDKYSFCAMKNSNKFLGGVEVGRYSGGLKPEIASITPRPEGRG
jgi:hypothetical protein